MSTESDRLLVQQIRAGGPERDAAWMELVARYEGRLNSFIQRRMPNIGLTEDVVQETFIGFLNSLQNYDDKRDLQGWLFTIAAHKVTDQLRKLGRRPAAAGGEQSDEIFDGKADAKLQKASSIARNREQIELEEAAISRVLRDLISGHQAKGEYVRIQVLELLFVKGWENKDIATHLNLAEQQIANYRFAAKKKLTEQLQSAGLPLDVFPELRQSTS